MAPVHQPLVRGALPSEKIGYRPPPSSYSSEWCRSFQSVHAPQLWIVTLVAGFCWGCPSPSTLTHKSLSLKSQWNSPICAWIPTILPLVSVSNLATKHSSHSCIKALWLSRECLWSRHSELSTLLGKMPDTTAKTVLVFTLYLIKQSVPLKRKLDKLGHSYDCL